MTVSVAPHPGPLLASSPPFAPPADALPKSPPRRLRESGAAQDPRSTGAGCEGRDGRGTRGAHGRGGGRGGRGGERRRRGFGVRGRRLRGARLARGSPALDRARSRSGVARSLRPRGPRPPRRGRSPGTSRRAGRAPAGVRATVSGPPESSRPARGRGGGPRAGGPRQNRQPIESTAWWIQAKV